MLSGASELIWGFTAAGMEHGRRELLFSAVLPTAGCAGLEAHQMFHKPLMSPFFFFYFWVVFCCIEVAHREVW